MHALLFHPNTRRLSTLAGWTAGVALLTPLIVLAGLLAVVALTTLTLSRHAGGGIPVRRRAAPALAPVLRLAGSSADTSLGVASRRAA